MENIRNTESLTKFLRSKDAPLDQILPVAQDVLNHKLGFELPDGSLFILDLICDRLGDNKFQHWRLSTLTWSLFNTVWRDIKDSQAKERIFRKVKLLDVLTKIFEQFFAISNQDEFFSILLESTTMVYQQFDIQGDETSCLNFLIAFTNIFQTDLEDALIISWCSMSKKLFEISTNEIDYTLSRKHATRFFKTCLPKLLNSIQNLDASLEPCESDITAIIIDTILSKDQIPSLLQNIQQLLKISVPPTSVYLLFKIIVGNIGNKHLKSVEDIYLVITEAIEYNEMSESLIEVLSTSNKPLSTAFFESVYTSTIKLYPVNWKLIGHIINLDVTLAMDKATEIIELLNNEDDTVSLQFIPSLVKAYVSARELFEFITLVWQQNITNNKVWASDTVVDLVSRYINDLSSSQMAKVIEHVNSHASTPIIVAIAKGIVNCSVEKVSAIEETVFASENFFNTTSSEAKFYLLMCYPDRVKKFHTDIEQVDEFYFYTLFRVAEVTGDIQLITNTVVSKFITFINEASEQCLKVILQRWSVILSATFELQQLEAFVEVCSKSFDTSYWIDFLQTSDYFYEQKPLVGVVVKRLARSDDPELINLISLVPLQVMGRSIRLEAMNKAAEHKCTKTLKHLLLQPTFKSTIETDMESLISLIHNQDYEDIFLLVWNNYLKQSKSDNSFVSQTVKKFSKIIKHAKSFDNEVKAIGLIVAETDVSLVPGKIQIKLSSLKAKLLKKLTKFITKDANDPLLLKGHLKLLNRLLDTETSEFSVDTIKQIGADTRKLNDKEINNTLFEILTKVSHVDSYKHIIALYVLLSDPVDLEKSLQRYFIKISNKSEFDEVIYLVLQSLTTTIDGANCDIFISLTNCIIKSLQKESNGEQKLSMILSIMLNRFDTISSNLKSLDLLLNILRVSLTDTNWCFNQYSIELVINFVTKVASILAAKKHHSSELEPVYMCSTQVVSQILLYHRFRLNSRHHSVMNVFIALLKPLTLKSCVSTSSNCSSSYARLLGNLCEPSNASKSLINHKLTTASSIIKKNLRKYLPVLLVHYITLSLTENFSRVNNDQLVEGIFKIFDVLSQRELNTTNELLDSQGVVAYKSLYKDYKSHGKWTDN